MGWIEGAAPGGSEMCRASRLGSSADGLGANSPAQPDILLGRSCASVGRVVESVLESTLRSRNEVLDVLRANRPNAPPS